MFKYFTVNQLFIELIFPLIYTTFPIVLTYILFEPLKEIINDLIKKT